MNLFITPPIIVTLTFFIIYHFLSVISETNETDVAVAARNFTIQVGRREGNSTILQAIREKILQQVPSSV